MRETFTQTLIKLAHKDDRIWFLTAGLSFGYFDKLKKALDKKFIECGICEQTMMGIASGLALAGKKPYVYSIANFAVMRPYEFIRNDICYQNLDVKIIGFGGKNAYPFMEFTHNLYNDEDIKILKVLPNIEIYVPKTIKEVKYFLLKSYQTLKPTYIRLDRIKKASLF